VSQPWGEEQPIIDFLETRNDDMYFEPPIIDPGDEIDYDYEENE